MGTWQTLNASSLYSTEVTGMISPLKLYGLANFQLYEGIADAFWTSMGLAGAILLFYGVSRWRNPKPYQAGQRLNRILRDYMSLENELV